MAELEDKLNAILGNPEAMGQIMNIAKALTSEGGAPAQAPDTDKAVDVDYSPVENDGESSADAENGGFDPFSVLGDLDPRLIQTAMRLFSEYSATDDRKIALLSALKPFLKEERYAKVDKAIQIAKLSRVIRVAFQLFKGGNADGDV